MLAPVLLKKTHLPAWPDSIVRTVWARLLSITTVFCAA